MANSAMNGAIGFARVRLYSNDPVLCLAGQTGELLPDVLGHEYPPIFNPGVKGLAHLCRFASGAI